MDIGWLQDFLAVAETGNFTRAARIRNISQAAFSRRIANLEAWAGSALIDRSSFPTRLTPEGVHFRERASEIVQQVTDARLSVTDADISCRSQVRVALPHALATGRLPAWWSAWSKKSKLQASCTAVPGNVHDTVTALVSGAVDILVCFYSAQEEPMRLSSEHYERAVIGTESFRPYVASASAAHMGKIFPGRRGSPLPLLTYSSGAYLARIFSAVLASAPERLIARSIFESDMAAVLRNMAVHGHGIAWLPDCSAAEAPPGALEPIGADGWSTQLSVVAYRDKRRRDRLSEALWSALLTR